MDRKNTSPNVGTDRNFSTHQAEEHAGPPQPAFTEVKNAHAAGDGSLGRSEQVEDEQPEGDEIY